MSQVTRTPAGCLKHSSMPLLQGSVCYSYPSPPHFPAPVLHYVCQVRKLIQRFLLLLLLLHPSPCPRTRPSAAPPLSPPLPPPPFNVPSFHTQCLSLPAHSAYIAPTFQALQHMDPIQYITPLVIIYYPCTSSWSYCPPPFLLAYLSLPLTSPLGQCLNKRIKTRPIRNPQCSQHASCCNQPSLVLWELGHQCLGFLVQ